jgi:hypothetical protein
MQAAGGLLGALLASRLAHAKQDRLAARG